MIIVTGGAGFIGSCLIESLNRKGITDILVVDHMTESDKWKNLIGKKFTDYLDRDELRMIINDEVSYAKVDKIYHMGACSTTTERDVNYLLDNNFAYSKELFAYAQRENASFIYASSAATYGSGTSGYSDQEYDELKPLNAYGYSKYLFDQWILHHGYADDVLGLKFFNVFGPNEYHKGSMASMIYKSWQQIKDEGKIRLFKSNDEQYPDGGQMRDFVYIKDALKAIEALEEADAKGIFNIGTGKARSWNDLATAVFNAMGREVNIEYIDMPDSLKGQYQNFTEADLEKFRSTVGKEGFHYSSLEDNVRDYVEQHLQNEWKYL